jgi:hypothetical protein
MIDSQNPYYNNATQSGGGGGGVGFPSSIG